MANFANYQEGKAAMFMLETQQRAFGTMPAAAATENGGEPPSVLNGFHQQRSLPSDQQRSEAHQQQQQYHYRQNAAQENNLESPARKGSTFSLNRAHEDSAATACNINAPSAYPTVNASSAVTDDIRKCGYLRKQKHGHKRFFVLRASSHLGPSRLEYYDSEKKFRNALRSTAAGSTAASSGGTAVTASQPKRVIYLYQCFTVNKRADAKSKHLIALYTKDEYFAIVAENEPEQEEWYQALSELMSEGKRGHMDAEETDDGYGTVTPGTDFKEVWQVNVKPKGLGQTKNLTGVYRLCLSAKSIHLMKLNSETPCVNLQLMNIRRCGHSESFFFIEVGRSSSIGPGELWMQVDDSVVAQNMHETILETMKALKAYAEFRPRSKSQSSGSNPMGFITTRRHLGNLPPSQTGLQRRSRTESVVGTPSSRKNSGANGYRFRTSSEGESTMNRPFRSVTGSLIHLNTARANLSRQENSSGAGARYIRAPPGSTYHARSASLPVSHFPSTTSPVSMSSSSGHGSVTDTITRPSSTSICGSPSDGGFNSSDEYGSSPGDFRYFRVRSNTPESLGNTPPIREEHCLSDYMAMGFNRDVYGTSEAEATRDENANEDSQPGSLRKRTTSFSRQVGGASTPVAVYQKMTQTTFSQDEAVVESSSWSASAQTISTSSSLCSDYSSSSEHSQDRFASLRPADAHKDDGYMPMIAGVLPSTSDADYMPMQPNIHLSGSPQVHSAALPVPQHMDSQGYMMMLPGRSGSTDSPAPSSLDFSRSGDGRRASNHLTNAEYMDMAQNTATPNAQKVSNDNYYALTTPVIPKSHSPYFSLPRSYKAPSRDQPEHDEYVAMSSPVKSVCTTDCSSSCPPSETTHHNGCTDRHAVRPNRLPLGRRSLHGSLRTGETAMRPSSPGEYINIEFGDRPNYPVFPLSAEGPVSTLNISREQRKSPLPQDYMIVEVGSLPPKSRSPRPSLVAPWNPPSYILPSSSSHCNKLAIGKPDDYTEMSFAAGEESKSPTDMLERLCILERQFFPFTPQTEPKVVRADPQGRRRHSSETFMTSSGTPVGSSQDAIGTVPCSSQQVGCSKCQNSASFDSVWTDSVTSSSEVTPGTSSERANSPSWRPGSTLPAEHQNGLNYIALDLRDDLQPGNTCGHDAVSLPSSSAPPEDGAYASIDLIK
ncbi:insulin receptor substrate 2-B-like [Xyrauchen texanus]|uniref:insulin receptor substrate 2-B-like n=1 Tax=Xyrauchen texanus TaxID=154827 RepID=UPI0022427CC5|nr:insulin receptor substrate 2-B-like [Xyrauchen texanus]